jgi:hypothetical protein
MARVAPRESVIRPVPPPVRDAATGTPTPAPKLEEVARRAYERFLMRGGSHGHDQEDWFAAEREVQGTDRG